MNPPKYKIGDLVVINDKFSFGFCYVASPGDVGLISLVIEAKKSDYFHDFTHDYHVLVNGLEFLFFEDELDFCKDVVNKKSKRIKFILFKK